MSSVWFGLMPDLTVHGLYASLSWNRIPWDVYQVALEVARWVVQQPFPRGLSDLKNQAIRSASSVVLNIAEGSLRRGKARRNHYEIARGSAAETLAVLMIVDLEDAEEQAHKLRRVDRMLQRMGG